MFSLQLKYSFLIRSLVRWFLPPTGAGERRLPTSTTFPLSAVVTGFLLLGSSLSSSVPSVAQVQSAPAAIDESSRADEIKQIRSAILDLQQRLDRLDHVNASTSASSTSAKPAPPASGPPASGLQGSGLQGSSASSSNNSDALITNPPSAVTPEDRKTLDFFGGTTLNFGVDGYYAYNFDHPIGRVNLLRAYDVSSNSFSINQASLVIEHLPQSQPGKRFGGRIDLQFGQATETLQGSSANEQRPQVWRNLFQAYGSYLAPIGTGVQVDFGKWASSLGVEGNYTKDQINYSRAYLFNYLPFYHMGFRANYNLTSKVNVAYWLVNGAQQTEDSNGFKSQAFIATLKPAKSLTWNVNYYFGQEQRNVQPTINPGIPTSPTQPGLPLQNISPSPDGREHIFDTYATWTVNPKLTVVGEGDYVISRTFQQSAPAHVSAAAAYVRYALPRSSAVAARTEYLSDRGGLFSGTTQALKEATFTFEHQFEPGLISRLEYRRDFSNQRFFLTDRTGLLSPSQTTATLGLVYWWGQKQGSW